MSNKQKQQQQKIIEQNHEKWRESKECFLIYIFLISCFKILKAVTQGKVPWRYMAIF